MHVCFIEEGPLQSKTITHRRIYRTEIHTGKRAGLVNEEEVLHLLDSLKPQRPFQCNLPPHRLTQHTHKHSETHTQQCHTDCDTVQCARICSKCRHKFPHSSLDSSLEWSPLRTGECHALSRQHCTPSRQGSLTQRKIMKGESWMFIMKAHFMAAFIPCAHVKEGSTTCNLHIHHSIAYKSAAHKAYTAAILQVHHQHTEIPNMRHSSPLTRLLPNAS